MFPFATCEMTAQFWLPQFRGRQLDSLEKDIPKFDYNKLRLEKRLGRGTFDEVFSEFRPSNKNDPEKVVIKRMLEVQYEYDTRKFIKEVKHSNSVQFKRVCIQPCTLMFE